jgi:hypothetical protein
MPRPKHLVASLSVLVCLSLTACQDSDESAAEPSSPTTSTATSPTGSSSAAPSPDAAAEEFLQRLERGMGTRGTAHMEMRIGGRAATTAAGDLRYGKGGSELHLTSRNPTLGKGTLEMVVLRKAAYLSIPGVTKPGTFVHVDSSNPRFKQLAGASVGMSPAESVKAFRAGLVSATDRGQDTVQGVPTTKYDVKVDSARALQAQGSDAVPGMPDTLTYQVWLDGQDRMRRMALGVQGVRLRIDLSRWGQPVVIEAPAKSQVVQAPPGF